MLRSCDDKLEELKTKSKETTEGNDKVVGELNDCKEKESKCNRYLEHCHETKTKVSVTES